MIRSAFLPDLSPIGNQRGVALLAILAIVIMLTFLGTVAIITSKTEVDISGVGRTEKKAFYAAEAGVEKVIGLILENYQTHGIPPEPLPSGEMDVNGYTVTYSTIDQGPAEFQTLNRGAYQGLYAEVKAFTVEAEAIGGPANSRVRVTQDIEDALIPLFQFAVFYEDDLEIAPGPNMTLTGRVHTNANMYLQSENHLNIESYTTAAGSMHHGRHPESGKSDSYGDVFIKDAAEEYENMKNQDATWLDCEDPSWVYSSLQRWDGLVEDGAHGITELYLPVVSEGEPIDLIRRAGGGNNDSYENAAGLKFVDGSVYWLNDESNWVDVTSTMIQDSILTYSTFFNFRETKWISSYNIDISKLNNSSYLPDNGIIYAAHTDNSHGAVRLVNGAELDGPLTVASLSPLYTLGDYNSVNKKSAALISDSYNVLSNAWDDALSPGSLNLRTASNTIVNACFMTGNVPSRNNNYSGGLENLPRFLEKWTDKTFTFRGSMVDLWESQQASGIWYYGGYFYTAPNQDWAFDTMYLDSSKLPPGTPMINAVQRGRWIHHLASMD
ncbi:hypothetical protein ACFL0G_02260 [Candidatus Zixiibacteriota bacterium]